MIPRLAAFAATTAAAVAAGAAATPAATTDPRVLRPDGIGPLKLGMTRADAVRTGWLSDRRPGCELARPRPVTYRLTGAKAPDGMVGTVEFTDGRLRVLSFTKGVRTALGVRPGVTSLYTMGERYRRQGWRVRLRRDDTFGGTFLTARRYQDQRIGAFGTGRKVETLAVPAVPTCE